MYFLVEGLDRQYLVWDETEERARHRVYRKSGDPPAFAYNSEENPEIFAQFPGHFLAGAKQGEIYGGSRLV